MKIIIGIALLLMFVLQPPPPTPSGGPIVGTPITAISSKPLQPTLYFPLMSKPCH